MSPFATLVDCVVALVEIRTKVNIRAKVNAGAMLDGLTDPARDNLVSAFEALQAIKVGCGQPSFLICERDDVTLRVTANGLVHNSTETKAFVENEHWTDGATAGLTVNGHAWSWSEMVDGVIVATKDVFDFAFGGPIVKRKAGARKDSYADEPTAKLLKTAKTLIKVNYGGRDHAEVVQAKLGEAGVNAGPVTVAAVLSMLEQTAETCRRAAFPRIDAAIARLQGTDAKETMP